MKNAEGQERQSWNQLPATVEYRIRMNREWMNFEKDVNDKRRDFLNLQSDHLTALDLYLLYMRKKTEGVNMLRWCTSLCVSLAVLQEAEREVARLASMANLLIPVHQRHCNCTEEIEEMNFDDLDSIQNYNSTRLRTVIGNVLAMFGNRASSTGSGVHFKNSVDPSVTCDIYIDKTSTVYAPRMRYKPSDIVYHGLDEVASGRTIKHFAKWVTLPV